MKIANTVRPKQRIVPKKLPANLAQTLLRKPVSIQEQIRLLRQRIQELRHYTRVHYGR